MTFLMRFSYQLKLSHERAILTRKLLGWAAPGKSVALRLGLALPGYREPEGRARSRSGRFALAHIFGRLVDVCSSKSPYIMTNDSPQPETILEQQPENDALHPPEEGNSEGLNAATTEEVEGLDPNGAVTINTPADAQTVPASTESSELSSERVEVIEALQMELDSLRQRYEQQTQQLEAHKTQAVRIAADFDNFRKRTQREKEELEYLIKRNTIIELLGVVDNFERARAQIKPNTDSEMVIHKSYQGVYKNLVDSLKRLGVSAMRPEGQPFDPNFHEAMFREQTNEYPEGAVIEQLQRGYLLNDRVLRHAMVKVAAPADEPAADQQPPAPPPSDAPPEAAKTAAEVDS